MDAVQLPLIDLSEIEQGVRRLVKKLDAKLRERLSEFDLSISGLAIINEMGDRRSVAMKDIQARLDMSKGNFNEVSHALESSGWLVIAEDPSDRRCRIIRPGLRMQGEELADVRRISHLVREEVLGDLPERIRQALSELA